MTELPGVTLACVETRHHGLAVQALRACMRGCRFARTVLLTDAATLPESARAAAESQGVAVEPIGPIDSIGAYSQFMLHRLVSHVPTGHVLVVQWDGYVLDARAWDEAFLRHDYIGAVWPFAPLAWQVGNGGFSLRSTRLLQAVRDLAPAESSLPEDILICRELRSALEARGLRFADAATARRFSFELEVPAGTTFGFHGLPNLNRVLPFAELVPWLEALPAALMAHQEAVELGFRCLAAGRLDAARIVARRRQLAGLKDGDTRDLALRCWSRTEACWCGGGASFRRCHGMLEGG